MIIENYYNAGVCSNFVLLLELLDYFIENYRKHDEIVIYTTLHCWIFKANYNPQEYER